MAEPTILGGDGGGGGADTTVATGADTTVAAAGADTLAAAAGEDTLTGADTSAGEDTASAAAGDDTKASDGKDVIPEAYAIGDLPNGVVVDEAMLGEFTPLAKELGLDQARFDKLMGFYADKIVSKQVQEWANTVGDWAKQAKADPEFGGTKFDESVTAAGRALDQFGTPELRKALDASGLGSHPELIRTFARVGRAISEDGFVTGREKAKPGDAASILYPDA